MGRQIVQEALPHWHVGVLNVNSVNILIPQTMLFLGVQLLGLCGVCAETRWDGKILLRMWLGWLSNLLQYKAGQMPLETVNGHDFRQHSISVQSTKFRKVKSLCCHLSTRHPKDSRILTKYATPSMQSYNKG